MKKILLGMLVLAPLFSFADGPSDLDGIYLGGFADSPSVFCTVLINRPMMPGFPNKALMIFQTDSGEGPSYSNLNQVHKAIAENTTAPMTDGTTTFQLERENGKLVSAALTTADSKGERRCVQLMKMPDRK